MGKPRKSKSVEENLIENYEMHTGLIIYADGSGDGRVALYLETKDENGQLISPSRQPKIVSSPATTNNEAEWEALLAALAEIKGYEPVLILMDSRNVVEWFYGRFKTHNIRMRRYRDKVHEIVKKRALNVKLIWVRREDNKAGFRLEK